MKQLEVQIMGQSYTLSAPSEEVADLRAAIVRVDAAMCRIRDAGKIKARDRIAVLAALQMAFDGQQAQDRRMQAIDTGGERRIGAVHAEGVLREIVGAHGEEIGFLRQLVGEDCGCGRLDHHAQFDVLGDAHFLGQPIKHGARGRNLGHIGDHR